MLLRERFQLRDSPVEHLFRNEPRFAFEPGTIHPCAYKWFDGPEQPF